MRWAELLWLPPVMLAIAVVLGSAGRQGFRVIARSIFGTLVTLTGGVLAVGVVIHVIARLFA